MSYSLEMEFDDSLEIELDDQPMPSPPSARSRRGLDNTTERRQEWTGWSISQPAYQLAYKLVY